MNATIRVNDNNPRNEIKGIQIGKTKQMVHNKIKKKSSKTSDKDNKDKIHKVSIKNETN